LAHAEGIASGGTQYQLELQAFRDDRPHGPVRVCGDLSVEPQRQLWGFLPVYTPNISLSFLMFPEGRLDGESGAPMAEPGAGAEAAIGGIPACTAREPGR
jgi:hypothetical protein